MLPILNIEKKWLSILSSQCKQQFAGIHLPSHDEEHHLRVWQYAKQLLLEIHEKDIEISETAIEQLMIAVFFHDQGMSKSLTKEHGIISLQICNIFFETSVLPPPSDFEKVLQVIEEHDKKDYVNVYSESKSLDIQPILNIADDLDAFGTVGVYRYLEIYLLRKTPIEKLPEVIQSNLASRFQYFKNAFYSSFSFIKSQEVRYQTTCNYFNDLAEQLKSEEYKPTFFIGPIGVLNYVRNEIIEKKRSPKEVCKEVISLKDDFYCLYFFEKLLTELN